MRADRLTDKIGGIPADFGHRRCPGQFEPVRALDRHRQFGPPNVVERKAVVEKPDHRADGAGRVVVLGLAEQQRRASFDVAQVHIIAERRAHDAAFRVDREHDLGLRVVPGRNRVQAHRRAPPDRRHRLRLREDLGVGADADFEILRPQPLGQKHTFDLGRLRRTGDKPREAVADDPADLGAYGLRAIGIARRLFLDHAFDHRGGEGHATGLDGL